MISGQNEDHLTTVDSAHAAVIAAAIACGFDAYFERYTGHALVGPARFRRKSPTAGPRRSTLQMAAATRLRQRFDEAIADYWRTRKNSYDAILDPRSLDEYAEDENQFVRDFLRGLPIVNNARNANLEEMEPWKRRLHLECKRDPRRVFELVRGLVVFAESFATRHSWENLLAEAEPLALPFEPLEIPWEHLFPADFEAGTVAVQSLCVPGVIGLGITSALLHYRQPALLPWRSRFALTGLHFLATPETGSLETSEFVLWDVQRGGCYPNFTYRYSPFVYHVTRVAQRLEQAAEALGVPFPEEARMILAHDFLSFVAEENSEETKDWASPTEELA
jgi:hypothetical protein